MRKSLVIILLAIVAVASPAHAAKASKASKEENIGVGAGAVVGAIAGGPVGFVVGAAIGAKVGETMHKKSETIESLNNTLDSSRGEVDELENELRAANGNIDTLSAELERFRELDRAALVDLMQAGIAMDLLFRTDEHVLTDTTGGRLAALAGDLAAMPDIHVRLDGFADERGAAEHNLQLSRKRAEFVRDQLIAAGVHPSRIAIAAHGETPAQDATVDSFALERRVSLTLFIDAPQPFASDLN